MDYLIQIFVGFVMSYVFVKLIKNETQNWKVIVPLIFLFVAFFKVIKIYSLLAFIFMIIVVVFITRKIFEPEKYPEWKLILSLLVFYLSIWFSRYGLVSPSFPLMSLVIILIFLNSIKSIFKDPYIIFFLILGNIFMQPIGIILDGIL